MEIHPRLAPNTTVRILHAWQPLAKPAAQNWSSPAKTKLLFALSQLWPTFADWILQKETSDG